MLGLELEVVGRKKLANICYLFWQGHCLSHSKNPSRVYNSNQGSLQIIAAGSKNGRKLDISHDPCSINDEPGTCMFNSECFKRKGIVLGACRDGFLFGACCAINPNASSVVLDDMEKEEDTAGTILDKIDELMDTLKAGLL